MEPDCRENILWGRGNDGVQHERFLEATRLEQIGRTVPSKGESYRRPAAVRRVRFIKPVSGLSLVSMSVSSMTGSQRSCGPVRSETFGFVCTRTGGGVGLP